MGAVTDDKHWVNAGFYRFANQFNRFTQV